MIHSYHCHILMNKWNGNRADMSSKAIAYLIDLPSFALLFRVISLYSSILQRVKIYISWCIEIHKR